MPLHRTRRAAVPVKYVEFSAIDGRRLLPASQVFPNIQIVTNSTVTLISEVSEREATVTFRFDTNFRGMEKIVAVIQIEGHLTYEGKGLARDLARQWSTTSQMPPEVASEIHSAIMMACIPDAVLMAKELRLPPPIMLPQIQIPSASPPSPPRRGPEVA